MNRLNAVVGSVSSFFDGNINFFSLFIDERKKDRFILGRVGGFLHVEFRLFAVSVEFFVESLRLIWARTIVLFDGGSELRSSVGNRVNPFGERRYGAQFANEGSAMLSSRGYHPFVEQAIERRPGDFRGLSGEESAVSEDKHAAQRHDED